MPLRKLSDLDVRYVSLVDRGANRIPFRIIKSQEKDMSLDLSALGFRVKKADAAKALAATGVVTGVVFAHGDADTATAGQAILKAAGMDFPEATVFEDGTVAVHKSDEALEDGTIVRLNSSVAVIVKDADQHLTQLKKSAFGDMAEAQGYFDGPSQVMTISQDSVRAVLQKSDSTETAATAVRDSMEAITQYMDLITKMLPTEILKLEVQLENLVKASWKDGPPDSKVTPGTKPAGSSVSDINDGERVEVDASGQPKKDSGPTGTKPVAKGGEKGVNPFAKKKPADQAEGSSTEAEGGAEDMAEGGAEAKAKAKKEDDSLAQVLKAVSDLAGQVTAISKTVESLTGEVKSIQKSTEQKIDVLAKKADTATHAVRGTVISSDLPSDPVPLARVKKADSDPRAGVFDTAFMRR
jgi:hypothetical protein